MTSKICLNQGVVGNDGRADDEGGAGSPARARFLLLVERPVFDAEIPAQKR